MNYLIGHPATEKVEALIYPAAEAGAEYSDDNGWLETVGEWEPSKAHLPSRLDKTLDAIRIAGMIPGL
jgi:alpha-galactosidase